MAKNKDDYFSNSLPWVQNSQDEEKPISEASNEPVKQKSAKTSERKTPIADKRIGVNTSESVLTNTPISASNEVLKRQKVTYYINPAFAKKFKILAIERDLEMSELADEAVSDILKKYGVI